MEKPILFKTEMIRAIISGNKRMTRRVIKPQPKLHRDITQITNIVGGLSDGEGIDHKPRYQVGDRLWVKEAWAYGAKGQRPDGIIYKAEKYARIWLEVTGIRVERVQDINYQDIVDEGWDSRSSSPFTDRSAGEDASDWYRNLWDSINGKKHPWESNPWCWVISFKEANHD